VLFWSRATRDLLKSFGWGIAATPSVRCSDEVATFLVARPIASSGSAKDRRDFETALCHFVVAPIPPMEAPFRIQEPMGSNPPSAIKIAFYLFG
jgi:hypothetical protein